MDATHDPQLTSWVTSAKGDGCDFPVQNLPFGVFRRKGKDEQPRVGVAIGDQIVDVGRCLQLDLFRGDAAVAAGACVASSLNPVMALGSGYRIALRRRLSELLSTHSPDVTADPDLGDRVLVPMADAEIMLPALVGDYTDFYASVLHATNVGRMFRPENPLLPNYKYLPVGYHGRSSSLVVSGAAVRRPFGQTVKNDSGPPQFGPSAMLDYELEVGVFVGTGNTLGNHVPIEEAEQHMFGLCLVNDWSARDVQKWEYQPLGPFLAKSFLTSVSPWVVTLEALEPFRTPALRRPPEDPVILPYLLSERDQREGGIDITLEVYIASAAMRASGVPPVRLSRGTFRDMYWTIGQMLTHHTSNGCNLRPGDLLASGTVSGSEKSSRGCLLELTWRGKEPIDLPGGEVRRFLEDGDQIIIRGYCERDGYVRIGFGECEGTIAPAHPGR
ncbi:MAG: fumarylacetoacetase [Ignavibacteria bacterium]|nr:fumarylacetoacetase [Ignavibacteria bacterium]